MFFIRRCNQLLASMIFGRNYAALPTKSRYRAFADNKMGKVLSSRASSESERVHPVQISKFMSVDLSDANCRPVDVGVKDIDFGNPVQAFKQKSNKDIVRALCVLRMCSLNIIVNNSLEIMNWTKRITGSGGLRMFVKPLFYKQFVGGENPQEIQKCLRKINETGIRPMLAAAMEEDVGQNEERNEQVYESNCSRIMECIEMATMEVTPLPMMQIKMSALLPADLLVTLGTEYRKTTDKLALVTALSQAFTAESFDITTVQLCLDETEQRLLTHALFRLKKIGQESQSRGVKVLVDAEYTYLNDGLSLLTMAMVSVYNQTSAHIWNTYQCYLKRCEFKLREELEFTEQFGTYFGAKLVRGAYLTQERSRAQQLGLPDPIWDDYQATNINYNTILKFLLEHRKDSTKSEFIIASHNEESILFALQKMKELNIEPERGGVCFGQLYGMSDQITYTLAQAGYAVYKSIPYGTLEEVLPYLARRAQENKSVLEGTRREQSMLWKAMKARLRPKHNQITETST